MSDDTRRQGSPETEPGRERECADAGELALLCKALAHPARVRIVDHLARAGRCICGEIVEIMPLAQSTVSQHLKILKECGLVQGEIEGPRTCYCLDAGRLARFVQLATALERGAKAKDEP
ncbi:ArsR/SmtB family transcription factor [Desulfocurvus vexinensis]|uniref:ArsR/SmtB family transcription factor n=1 Tax=Desulfocurvus vexinensis TaxID=399548 RepID=UPI0004BC3122|nr:metalloregulator ArsR/SmtB family transcription factor [Desulfocurvus vexinensis]